MSTGTLLQKIARWKNVTEVATQRAVKVPQQHFHFLSDWQQPEQLI